MLFEIDDLIVFYFYPFRFKQLLHQIRTVKMVLPRQHSDAIDHPVCGHVFPITRRIHRPTHHPCRSGTSEHLGNGAIGSHFSVGYLPRNLINAFKKIVVARVL